MSRLPPSPRQRRAVFEALERRQMLSVTVKVGSTVRAVDPDILGVNLAWWDSYLQTPQTKQLVQAAGINEFRFPGGSTSDTWHFNVGPTYGSEGTTPSMAQFIASVNGTGIVTVNYGTGSPQEGAALLAYLNFPANDATTVNIGNGQQWNATTNSWQTVNWQTANFWANLRAAKPLATDDGLNFLRLGRTQPVGIHYFEMGNEIYGSWETDEHGQTGDTSLDGGLGAPHDPATYVAFAKLFSTLAAQIDPTISIGVVASGAATYEQYYGWLNSVLTMGAAVGFTPGFISDHSYMQAPGAESDSTLLNNTVADLSGGDFDWVTRANNYETLLKQDLGSKASSVQLMATEYNSVYASPGKQSTSLVNGLFIADSIGSLLDSKYDGADVWDLRNGWLTTDNNASTLYGWRTGGDYGILGIGTNDPPQTATYVAYPSYYAIQLASKIVNAGKNVVSATSTDHELDAYAVTQTNGQLDLLVINKSPTAALTENINVQGFPLSGKAQVWQYGETQDTAQSQSTTGASALANFSTTLTTNGTGSVSYSFPAYSMTVLSLSPDLPEPSAATAKGYTKHSIIVTWDNDDAIGSDEVLIVRSLDKHFKTGVDRILLTGAPSFYVDGGLRAGTRYYYRVYNGDQWGMGQTEGTIFATTNPAKPKPMAAVAAKGAV